MKYIYIHTRTGLNICPLDIQIGCKHSFEQSGIDEETPGGRSSVGTAAETELKNSSTACRCCIQRPCCQRQNQWCNIPVAVSVLQEQP